MNIIKRMPYKRLLYYWGFIEKLANPSMLNTRRVLKVKTDIAYITFLKDEIVVAFDGTNHLLEWIGNLIFWPKYGFHRNCEKIATEFFRKLHEQIAYIPREKRNITCVCHSRGGLGLITALYIKKYTKNTKVVTFGSLRVATKRGIEKLEDQRIEHHRVEAAVDIVDNLPFNLFTFKHYQTFKYKMGTVWGKLDHLGFRRALEDKIREESD
jgi:hypothetical protein